MKEEDNNLRRHAPRIKPGLHKAVHVVCNFTKTPKDFSLDNEEKNKETKDILPYLLIIGIAGIGFNLYYKYERYYLGEPLVEKQIIIKEAPEYIKARKGGTDRYTFSGKNYRCRFWLSEGALTTINSNDNIKKEIESVKIGDTVEVKIRQTDEAKLEDTTARPRVIEFSKANNTVISSTQVQQRDKKWFYINFSVPILCLLIWIFFQLRRLIVKRKEDF